MIWKKLYRKYDSIINMVKAKPKTRSTVCFFKADISLKEYAFLLQIEVQMRIYA